MSYSQATCACPLAETLAPKVSVPQRPGHRTSEGFQHYLSSSLTFSAKGCCCNHRTSCSPEGLSIVITALSL